MADLEVDGRGLRLRLIDTGTEEEFSVLFLEDIIEELVGEVQDATRRRR